MDILMDTIVSEASACGVSFDPASVSHLSLENHLDILWIFRDLRSKVLLPGYGQLVLHDNNYHASSEISEARDEN